MKIILLSTLVLMLLSCSLIQTKKTLPSSKPEIQTFIYRDKTGDFSLERKTTLNADKKLVIVKQVLSSSSGEDANNELMGNALEEVASYSTPGLLKGKTNILRPTRSLFSVWFDKKKYTTEMKLNTKTHKLDVKVVSPEERFNGEKQFSFPKKTTGVFCFFSQLIECVRATDFIHTAIDKEAGEMNFHVIWENYPFIAEQYSDMPNEVFSLARLEYDGKNSKGEYKFALQLPTQTIFYFVDKNADFIKMFWVAQGISLVRQDKEADLEDNESEAE